MLYFLENNAFYCKTKTIYTPFKNGLYMEEFFLKYMSTKNLTHDKHGRLFIPALWTNFQKESWFKDKKDFMQQVLDFYVKCHPNPRGYFTIVQADDGPLLSLPKGTVIYGATTGDIPLPLICEDVYQKLLSTNRKTFKDKTILCSFVGNMNHNVRNTVFNVYKNDVRFKFGIINNQSGCDYQNTFINYTLNSKFAMAPRGRGKSSFRFFEIFQLGTIPVYIWDDVEWLPYKEIIDYKKISISIRDSDINNLGEILENVSEKSYKSMLEEYEKVKHMFTLEYMCEHISGFSQANREIMQKPVRCLLTTIVIGKDNLESYNKTFRKSHELYAKKHKYDFEVLNDYIETSYNYNKLSGEFQKLLICNKERTVEYDYIIYINSNTIINPKSPAAHCVCESQRKIGVVDLYQKRYPFDLEVNKILNSNIYIIQPAIHKSLLEIIYYEYVPDIMSQNQEPIISSDEMQIESVYTKTIPSKWNAIYKPNVEKLQELIKDNYFIHFFGELDSDKITEINKYLL
jgi:hypothetical protein